MPNQRDIVEVPYYLPQGRPEMHPAIVISNKAIHEIEDIFYVVMCSTVQDPAEFSMELTPDMINGNPMRERTYIKTHLIQSYQMNEVAALRGSVTIQAFQRIREQIINSLSETE